MVMMFWGKRQVEKKANPVGTALISAGDYVSVPKERARVQFREGYQLNVIVYKAVRELTIALTGLQLELHKGDKIIDKHSVIDLLKRPNPIQSYPSFLESIFTNFFITGEMFFSSVAAGKKIVELWAHNPEYMKVKPGKFGIPQQYIYEQDSSKIAWNVDQMTGRSDLFFLKTCNPLDYWRGQSPLLAGGLSVDVHNSGLRWNYSLLKNSARPSGIVKFQSDSVTGEVLNRLREWFKKSYQGADNAGEIPILVGGAEWQAIDLNPRDMDFLNTMKESAKYIAMCYGVPLPLIDNDASTFNNLEQAKERLYTDTVIPIMNLFLAQFNQWAAPYLDGAEFKINQDAITALERLREVKFNRMVKAVDSGVITINEARAEIGFDRYKEEVADQLLIPQGRIPIEMAGFEPEPTNENAPDEEMQNEGFPDDQKDEAKALYKAGFNLKAIREMIGNNGICTNT